jgi:prophage tail gpP-like protein
MHSHDETVSLIVAGHIHSTWQRYQIDSDFLVPSDAFSVTLGLSDGVFPATLTRGAPVRVRIGDEVVLSGRLDALRRRVSRQDLSLTLSGRDGAAVLVDCASPVFTSRQLSLEQVIAQVVRPLGVTDIRLQAESSLRADKITVEPGERAWDTLSRAAAARGLWPWFTPDGTLVIGGPDYTTPPVATLVLNRDGRGNNVLDLTETVSVNGCFSELTVLGQGHAHGRPREEEDDMPLARDAAPDDDVIVWYTGTQEQGQHGLRATVRDPTVPYYRPQIVTEGDADNQQQVDWHAKKKMADARLSGYDLTAVVRGHRTADGVLWTPGQRIRVRSEPHGIDAIFFLTGRAFSGGRPDTTLTTLRLKEDGIWIPDAFSKKRRQRHRRSPAETEITDVEPD